MTNKYAHLLEPLHLTNGAVLPNRIAMAPMVIEAAGAGGTVTEADLHYFSTRSQVAGMIITGAAAITEAGQAFPGQTSVASDDHLPGLTKLAAAIKQDGSKAILQLHHAGREARVAHAHLGRAVAPSAKDFPFLPYQPDALSDAEILEVITQYGDATKRAIAAGFDGVEIHGANHYLIQQFFSAYANERTDQWGGNLEKRMAFPLAVVNEVKRVVAASEHADFIVGYRITPEEIHGKNVGYTFDEALHLIDALADHKLDYIHLSIFTNYDAKPVGGDVSFGQAVKEKVADRAAVIIIANILTADAALAALHYGDIVAIGRGALIEPRFAAKIKAGQADEIASAVTPERLDDLAFPEGLIKWYTTENVPLPPLPGIEHLRN